MKFFISLLSLGTTLVGTFAGTLQQNLSHPQTPEIDRLFLEIEQDIRDFSLKNPLTKKVADEIKEVSSSSGSDSRRKRSDKDSDVEKSENTLGIWVEAWKNLISNYVKCLYITCDKEKKRIFTEENKNKAIENSKSQYKSEIDKFKEQLTKVQDKINEIYEKMKIFVLKIEFPKTYEYNNQTDSDSPYENYVDKILINN